MSQLLSFERFSYLHPGAHEPALSEITLTVADGEFVVVAGPSGAGKSTLLRAACGLAPGFDGGTASGDVVVGGMSTREHGAAELARVCGTVLQDPERQVVMGKVRAEIALPLESRGHNAAEVARAVEETSLLVGLEGLLDRQLSTLSGGELQRVATAAALACRPRLLLLDEPTSQLDPVAADSLIWLLRRLNEEQGIAIVIAEQRLERLLPAADRIVAMRQGSVGFDGGARRFLEWAADSAPELQTPAAALLAACGVDSVPVSVKEARAALAAAGMRPGPATTLITAENQKIKRLSKIWPARRDKDPLRIAGVWDERKGGQTILADVEISAAEGETIALMGRNGAGKSTLLKHAAGLLTPTRGSVTTGGDVAMLTQNPSDHLICERIGDVADAETLSAAGVTVNPDRHPRDLSGGERQRLAFELVAASSSELSVLLLDEPTRGLDSQRRMALAKRIRTISEQGTAVVLATHDAELAAEVADRIVLLADGAVLADGTPSEILAGGWYFTTETSRILGGAGGALLPADGAALLTAGSKLEPRGAQQ